jgi:hypothetical protein
MHRLRDLPPALRVTVYAVAIAALVALSVGVGVTATLLYERGTGLGGGAGSSEQESNQEQAQTTPDPEPTQISPGEYLTTVGAIQNGSVETFLDSHSRLLRYDTLTGSDVGVLEANYLTLATYSDQVENLNPPEEYEVQYELFSLAISELYAASEIAHRVADDPPSATQADFREYDEHVETATTSLQQSNQILGQSYRTTEGVSRVSLI